MAGTSRNQVKTRTNTSTGCYFVKILGYHLPYHPPRSLVMFTGVKRMCSSEQTELGT